MYCALLFTNQAAKFVLAPPPGPVSGGHGAVLDRQEDVRRPVRAPLPPLDGPLDAPDVPRTWP